MLGEASINFLWVAFRFHKISLFSVKNRIHVWYVQKTRVFAMYVSYYRNDDYQVHASWTKPFFSKYVRLSNWITCWQVGVNIEWHHLPETNITYPYWISNVIILSSSVPSNVTGSIVRLSISRCTGETWDMGCATNKFPIDVNPLRILGTSWGVKTTRFEAPGSY